MPWILQVTPQHCLYQPWLCSTKWPSLQSSFSSCIRWFSTEGTKYDILKATSFESQPVLAWNRPPLSTSRWLPKSSSKKEIARKRQVKTGNKNTQCIFYIYTHTHFIVSFFSLIGHLNILRTALTLIKPDRMAGLKICILTQIPQKETLIEEKAMWHF